MTKERNVALATQCVLCGTTHELMVDLKDAQEYMSQTEDMYRTYSLI